MGNSDRLVVARSFVRNCNVLLKQAALYGLKHNRCAAQLDTTWKDLQKALSSGNLMLCVSPEKISVGNNPLVCGTAEKNFSAFFVSANIGRIDLDRHITLDEFCKFVQICATGKPLDLLDRLKPEIGKNIGNIRVIELRVLDTASLADAPGGEGASGTGSTGGPKAAEFVGSGIDLGVLLSDPHKLLQLIDAIPSEPMPAGFAAGQGMGVAGGAPAGNGMLGGGGYAGSAGVGGGDGGFFGGGGDAGSGPAGPGAVVIPFGNSGGPAGTGSVGTGSGPGGGSSSGTPTPSAGLGIPVTGSFGEGSGASAAGNTNIGVGGGSVIGPAGPGGGGFGGGAHTGAPGHAHAAGAAPARAGGRGIGIGGGSGVGGGGTGTGVGSGSGIGGTGRGTGGAGTGTGARFSDSGGSGTDSGNFPAKGGGTGTGTGGSGGFQEADVVGVIQWLTRFVSGRNLKPDGRPEQPASNLQQAIQKLLPSKPTAEMRGALLMQVAEHVALRAINDKYKTQGLNVSAIQQMLDRMNTELENLRKVLHAREEEMGRAGLAVESRADVLDSKFWQGVSDEARRKVLLSSDAWLLPPNVVRSFAQPLLAAHTDEDLVGDILRNYLTFLDHKRADAVVKVSAGVGQLADLYARVHQLRNAVDLVGEKLLGAKSGPLKAALSESFILLGQETIATREYRALDGWLAVVEDIDGRDKALSETIHKRVNVSERVPEMVRIATETPRAPEGLTEVLMRLPDPSARYIAEKFAGCSTRDEGLRLARVLSLLGPVSIDPLREMLYRGTPQDAIAALGILTMLDPDFLRPQLSARLTDFNRAQQDAALRQISAAGTPERGSLLLDFIDQLDPLVLPLAVDEIGMAGSVSASKLIHLARGYGRARGLPFLRVKAIEAVGRLGETSAIPVLKQFVSEKGLLGWHHAREIRLVAAQALQKIDAEGCRDVLQSSGFSERELLMGPAEERNPAWIRQRKYPRVAISDQLVGSLDLPSGVSSIKINDISLGGGHGVTVRDPQGLSEAPLDLYIGLRKLHTQVFIRRMRPHEVCFEFVDMALDDRSRLREYVAEKYLVIETDDKSKDSADQRKVPETTPAE